MNIEKQRETARALCNEAGIEIHPYGNAWWLLGHGISRVVVELAGFTLSDLHRYQPSPR